MEKQKIVQSSSTFKRETAELLLCWKYTLHGQFERRVLESEAELFVKLQYYYIILKLQTAKWNVKIEFSK